MRILIIEDEKHLAESIKTELQSSSYNVDVAFDGETGEELLFVNEYDMVILDLNLPYKNGLEVCENARNNGIDTPMLMLTARDKVADKTLGLDTGADDYMVKPFDFDELRSRISALLRRYYGRSNPNITLGDLVIRPKIRQVFFKDNELSLTSREYDILHYLGLNYPDTVTLEQLLYHVWGEEINPFTNTIRVHLGNVRRKLKKIAGYDVIETLPTRGYRLCRLNK